MERLDEYFNMVDCSDEAGLDSDPYKDTKCEKCKENPAVFNFRDSPAKFCVSCKAPEMINIEPVCDKCKARTPLFNEASEVFPKFCDECKEPDMVNIKAKNIRREGFHKLTDYFEENNINIERELLFKIIKILNDRSPRDLDECMSLLITMFSFSTCNPTQMDKISKLIVSLCLFAELGVEPRIRLADTLFANQDTRVLSFHCFSKIVEEPGINLVLLMKALGYLFSSNSKPHMEKVAAILDRTVSDPSLHSVYVYKLLADILYMFEDPARKNYLNDVVWTFLCQKHHEIEQKIMACIYLLENRNFCSDIQVKGTFIFLSSTMENKQKTVTYNKQADAADALSRYGDGEYRERAKKVLEKLGGNKRNVYANEQSSHAVSESVAKFLTELKEKKVLLKKYGRFYEDIKEIYKKLCEGPKRHKFIKLEKSIHGALDRIGADPSKFCGMDMREICQRVYDKIYDEKDLQYRLTLIDRFFEELSDAYGTCTSGHVNRLANVFIGGVSISFEDQIKSNYDARFEALVKKIENEELKGNIMIATMLIDQETDDLDEEDQAALKAYHTFIAKNKDALEKELHAEFVGGKYVDEATFNSITQKYYEQIKFVK